MKTAKDGEIKFRTYDEDSKRMRYLNTEHDYIAFDECGNGYYYNMQTGLGEWFSGLMQYTGLKDKNGVEIYEGDILETCENYGIGECWLKYEVKYNKDLAQFILFPVIENGKYNSNNWDTPIYSYHEQAREVIGNIYERDNEQK